MTLCSYYKYYLLYLLWHVIFKNKGQQSYLFSMFTFSTLWISQNNNPFLPLLGRCRSLLLQKLSTWNRKKEESCKSVERFSPWEIQSEKEHNVKIVINSSQWEFQAKIQCFSTTGNSASVGKVQTRGKANIESKCICMCN